MKFFTYTLYQSENPTKKFDVFVPTIHGNIKKISFGAKGYEDYTIHKDPERRQRYRIRHAHDHIDDPSYPGFWSYHVLWDLPDLGKSYQKTLKSFDLKPKSFFT